MGMVLNDSIELSIDTETLFYLLLLVSSFAFTISLVGLRKQLKALFLPIAFH